MKQKLKKIILFCLVIFTLNYSILSYSAYTKVFQGNCNLEISAPEISLVTTSSTIEILDGNTYFNEFQVVNNSNTDLNLSYKISISTSMTDAPLIFTLYEIDNDTEILVDLNSTFDFSKSNTHDYKLAVSYDNSYNPLDENTEVYINLEISQN